MQKTKVAILGAGFISEIHLESYHRFVPEAEVVARVEAALYSAGRPLKRRFSGGWAIDFLVSTRST